MANSYCRIIFSILLTCACFCGQGVDSPFSKLAKRTVAVTESKPIVLVVRSFNNEAVCEKNMASILEQDYPNYRVIFIDDKSSDNTFEKVKAYVEKHDTENRVTLIQNLDRQGP